MNLPLRIKFARIARKLTQEELGTRVERTRAAVHYWENGQNQPTLEMLEILAGVLSVPQNWLAFGHEPIPDFLQTKRIGQTKAKHKEASA